MIKMKRYIDLLNSTDSHSDGDLGINNLLRYLHDRYYLLIDNQNHKN